MVGWHHQLNGHEFRQTPGESEGEGSLVCWRVHGVMTKWLNSKTCDVHRSSRTVSPTLAIIFPWELEDVDIHTETGRERELILKMHVLVTQSCLTLCNPVDCSRPGSSVPGILQARILGWVAIPFSRGSSQPKDQTWVSCISGKFFAVWATKKAPSYEISKRDRKQAGNCQGLVGEKNGNWLLNGHRVSFWGDENVWELDTDGGCTTLWILTCSL